MDFKLGDEEEGSDYDMNSMEVEDSSCKQVNESSSKQKTDITQEKRKAEVNCDFHYENLPMQYTEIF